MSLSTLLDFLLRALFVPKPALDPPKCTVFGVPAAEIADIIFRDLGVPREHIHLSDAVYDLYPRTELDRFLADDDTNGRKYVPEVFDCFAPETPIICRIAGQTDILEIQDLAASPFPAEILNHEGQWVSLHAVWPKTTTVPVINWTYRGAIGLTKDHRVLSGGAWKDAETAARSIGGIDQLSIGHCLPSDGFNDVELGWALGLFFADGHAKSLPNGTGSQWRLSNYNRAYLERASAPFSKSFRDFTIKSYPSEKAGKPRGGVIPRSDMFHLEIAPLHPRRRDGSRDRLIREFRSMFYATSGRKKVPVEVLRASPRTKEAFLDGVWAGDGQQNNKQTKRITIHGKIGLLGLISLAENVGAEWKVDAEPRREDTYYFIYRLKGAKRTTGPRTLGMGGVRSRHLAHDAPGLRTVFDLNCDGGRFIAGNYKVHNCDNFAAVLFGNETAWEDAEVTRRGSTAFGLIWGHFADDGDASKVSGDHALCFYIDPFDKKAYLVEPQTDLVYKMQPGSKTWLVLC